jgi:hypothetical protein
MLYDFVVKGSDVTSDQTGCWENHGALLKAVDRVPPHQVDPEILLRIARIHSKGNRCGRFMSVCLVADAEFFFESGRLQKHKRSALDLWWFVHAPVYAVWHDRWEVKRKEGCCESADKVHVTRWIARLIFDDLWWSLYSVCFFACVSLFRFLSCKKRSLQLICCNGSLVGDENVSTLRFFMFGTVVPAMFLLAKIEMCLSLVPWAVDGK